MIRTTYSAEPKFPPTDQHPEAVRYRFGEVWVDCVGPLTEAEFEGYLLTQAKAQAAQAITQAAEDRRSAITAAAPGKQGAYLLKVELVLKADAGDEDARDLITAEATARGLTFVELRDLIITKRVLWERAAMAIETVEAASQAAVAAAVDRASVDAAVDTAKQLLAEIGG